MNDFKLFAIISPHGGESPRAKFPDYLQLLIPYHLLYWTKFVLHFVIILQILQLPHLSVLISIISWNSGAVYFVFIEYPSGGPSRQTVLNPH
jgi:hypothetical protein